MRTHGVGAAMLLAAAVGGSADGGPPAVTARELAAKRYAEVIHRMR